MAAAGLGNWATMTRAICQEHITRIRESMEMQVKFCWDTAYVHLSLPNVGRPDVTWHPSERSHSRESESEREREHKRERLLERESYRQSENQSEEVRIGKSALKVKGQKFCEKSSQ